MGTNQINTHVSIEPSNTLVNTDQPNNLANEIYTRALASGYENCGIISIDHVIKGYKERLATRIKDYALASSCCDGRIRHHSEK